MLEETYKCDGPSCNNTTPKDRVGPGWRVVRWLRSIVSDVVISSEDTREWHYCSYECEHKHTYLLISGDNGK